MLADVRFRTLVYTQHVFFQMWQLRERSITQNALERFFAGMPSFMQFQSSAMCKRFPAHLASVRLFTAMNTLMNCKLRSLSESSPTMRTTVRFVLLVGSHMLRQMAFKLFIAYLAVERSNVGVITIQMLLQCVTPKKRFAANVANEVADF